MTDRNAVKMILGTGFNDMFRCLDMLILNLGSNVKVEESDGELYPQFSFHVQTQWRFINKDKILLASRDIYIPYNAEINEAEWDYRPDDRPDDESSIFDVLQKTFGENLAGATVTFAEINNLGDLKIVFSNGIIFETFTPSTRKDEFFRFIHYREKEIEDFVIFE